MKKLTKDIVIDYHVQMMEMFNVELITPQQPIPKTLLVMLGKLGVDDDFLKKYAITLPAQILGTKTVIYVPWIPGVGKTDQYYVQIRRLAHECQHAVQIKNDRPFFSAHYLAASALRANYEALAMHAELELHFWYYGRAMTAPSLSRMANNLKAYRCSEDDISVTYKHLLAYNKVVARGSISSEAGKHAITWLEGRI